MLEGKKKPDLDTSWTEIPSKLCSPTDVKFLMQTIETCKYKVCSGVSCDKFESVLPDDLSQPVFYTKDGDYGAYVEVSASQFHQKSIRSTFCCILIPNDDVVHDKNLCEMCQKTEHYLRTLKSRNNKRIQTAEPENSKFTRLDNLSKSDLLEAARNSTKKLKTLKQQIKRLEDFKSKMVDVGNNTDSDFKYIFEDLYKGKKTQA